ncbi:hypothetical protein Sros01_45510 [Streptomyces roseochromogenus]|nr:hypothetical protein Sros01_45510 [Streptomyces roseochromogenus]
MRRARAARGPAAPGEGGLSPTSAIEVARAENRIRFGLSMRAGSEARKASDRAALGVKELPGRIRKSASSPPVIRLFAEVSCAGRVRVKSVPAGVRPASGSVPAE